MTSSIVKLGPFNVVLSYNKPATSAFTRTHMRVCGRTTVCRGFRMAATGTLPSPSYICDEIRLLLDYRFVWASAMNARVSLSLRKGILR